MKTNFFKTISVFLLLINCLWFIDCGDNCDNNNYYQYSKLGEDTLLVPHTGTEVLKFLRITATDTDTVIYYGQGRRYYTDSIYFVAEPCPYELVRDIQEINYFTANSDENLKILICGACYLCDEYHPSGVFFCLKGKIFEFHFSNNWLTGYGPYYEALTFYNKEYKFITTHADKSYCKEHKHLTNDTLYFSRYSGIVRISFSEDHYSLTKI